MSYIGKQPRKAALTSSDIEDGIITAAKIEDGAVVAAEIASNAVTTAKINADAVTAAKIADDVINSEHIAADSIDAEHYAAGSVDTTALGADAVTGAKIADDAINSEHYTDGSIDTAHLADGQVTTAKLATAVFTGATDIGAAIVDADLFLMDDGAGGTIRKTTASRIKTYAGGAKIKQVQHTNSTPFISTTSQSFQTLVSVAITPTASDSTILLFGSVGEPDQIDGRIKAYMHRGDTALSGSGAGGQIVSEMGRGLSDTGTEQHFGTVCNMMVDSPNTTSEVTYSIKVHSGTGAQIRVGNGGSSNMVAVEIGA